jgi:hypothetical protein
MKRWGQLFVMTIMATIVHLILIALLPLLNHGKLMVPDVLSKAYLWMVAALLVGYLILLILFFAIKKYVFRMGGESK